MKRFLAFSLIIIHVLILFSLLGAQTEPGKKPNSISGDKKKWTKTVWKKICKKCKEKRSFSIDKSSSVAGVRGFAETDTLFLTKESDKYPTPSELKKAIAILQNKIASNPGASSAPELKFYIGQCYQQSGNIDEAKVIYQELINKYPDNSFASKARKELAIL